MPRKYSTELNEDNVKDWIEELQSLSIATDGDSSYAYKLFNWICNELELTYFNPGEPEAECNFCGFNWPLPGCYGEDVMMSEEIESDERLDPDVYWTRVWAERALDLLDPQYAWEPCCKERAELMERLEL